MNAQAEFKVGSAEGIAILMQWARDTGAVLSEAHEAIAKKHGVSTEGVTITRPASARKAEPIWVYEYRQPQT